MFIYVYVYVYLFVSDLFANILAVGASTKIGFWVLDLQVNHEDFNEGIIQVQAKKKASLNYYA